MLKLSLGRTWGGKGATGHPKGVKNSHDGTKTSQTEVKAARRQPKRNQRDPNGTKRIQILVISCQKVEDVSKNVSQNFTKYAAFVQQLRAKCVNK